MEICQQRRKIDTWKERQILERKSGKSCSRRSDRSSRVLLQKKVGMDRKAEAHQIESIGKAVMNNHGYPAKAGLSGGKAGARPPWRRRHT